MGEPLKLPGLGELVGLPSRGYALAEEAMALLPRVAAMVAQAETLVAGASALLASVGKVRDRASVVVDRTDAVVIEASALIISIGTVRDRAIAVVDRTNDVVTRADALVGRITGLMDGFEPVLAALQPMAQRLADTTSPDEIDALVKLIDLMPELVDKVGSDIFPILDTLGTVAPDLRDVLDLVKELNEIIGSVPGFKRIKRKVEADQQAEDWYRADHEPPSSPDQVAAQSQV